MILQSTTPVTGIELVPAPKVAAECNVTRRTVSRWIQDPATAFPAPLREMSM